MWSNLILGTAWGYIESFLFWLLQDLGGSRSLMGITITVGGVFGIPLLVLSGPIIDKIGHANVIFIGFIFYAIRLLGTITLHFLKQLTKKKKKIARNFVTYPTITCFQGTPSYTIHGTA